MKIEMTWTEGLEVLQKIGMDNNWSKKVADPLMSSVFRRPVWNVCVFDDWMREKFGNYDINNDKSLADMIHEKFPEYENRLKWMFAVSL